jgi:hypothetical protein
MQRFYRAALATCVCGSLVLGVQTLTAQPSAAEREPTCAWCVCEGTKCHCEPMPCF